MDIETVKALAEVGKFFSGDYKKAIAELRKEIERYEEIIGLADTVEKANAIVKQAEQEKATAEGLVQKARNELSLAEERAAKVGQEVQQKAEAATAELRESLEAKLKQAEETLSHLETEKGRYRELTTAEKERIEAMDKALVEKASSLRAWESDLKARQDRIVVEEAKIAERQAKLKEVFAS